jgi:uncharacterized protein (DUF924 family)
MHSEDLDVQNAGMSLLQDSAAREPVDSPHLAMLQHNINYMERHQAIIKRFGRYPHRNVHLGRKSTPEEEEFMASGGDTFAPSRSDAK